MVRSFGCRDRPQIARWAERVKLNSCVDAARCRRSTIAVGGWPILNSLPCDPEPRAGRGGQETRRRSCSLGAEPGSPPSRLEWPREGSPSASGVRNSCGLAEGELPVRWCRQGCRASRFRKGVGWRATLEPVFAGEFRRRSRCQNCRSHSAGHASPSQPTNATRTVCSEPGRGVGPSSGAHVPRALTGPAPPPVIRFHGPMV